MLLASGRCREALQVFDGALDAAPSAAAARDWLTLGRGLALRDCGDVAWRQTLEELAAAAKDPEVLARARETLASPPDPHP